jgi:hypothetical protein
MTAWTDPAYAWVLDANQITLAELRQALATPTARPEPAKRPAKGNNPTPTMFPERILNASSLSQGQ